MRGPLYRLRERVGVRVFAGRKVVLFLIGARGLFIRLPLPLAREGRVSRSPERAGSMSHRSACARTLSRKREREKDNASETLII